MNDEIRWKVDVSKIRSTEWEKKEPNSMGDETKLTSQREVDQRNEMGNSQTTPHTNSRFFCNTIFGKNLIYFYYK